MLTEWAAFLRHDSRTPCSYGTQGPYGFLQVLWFPHTISYTIIAPECPEMDWRAYFHPTLSIREYILMRMSMSMRIYFDRDHHKDVFSPCDMLPHPLLRRIRTG